MQKLQNCRKTKRYVVRVPHCSRAFCSILTTALRSSARLPYGSIAADVRQMRGWRTITSVVRTPCVPCSSLATALCVLRLPYVSQKTQTNRKENEHACGRNLVLTDLLLIFGCCPGIFRSTSALFRSLTTAGDNRDRCQDTRLGQ